MTERLQEGSSRIWGPVYRNLLIWAPGLYPSHIHVQHLGSGLAGEQNPLLYGGVCLGIPASSGVIYPSREGEGKQASLSKAQLPQEE